MEGESVAHEFREPELPETLRLGRLLSGVLSDALRTA